MNSSARPTLELATLQHAAYAAEAEVEAKAGRHRTVDGQAAGVEGAVGSGGVVALEPARRASLVREVDHHAVVDRLEADGFVARQADPHDRRARLAVLTAPGRRACQEGVALQQAAERKLPGGLSAPEAQQLAALLAKVKPSAG